MYSENKIVKISKIYREKASGLVAHCGLKLIYSDNTVLVFHNTPKEGTHISTYEAFAEGKIVKEHRSYIATKSMLERLNNLLVSNKRYNLFDLNCEQAVSIITDGIAGSPQVKNAIISALFFGCGAKIQGKSNKNSWILASVGALIGLSMTKSKLLR